MSPIAHADLPPLDRGREPSRRLKLRQLGAREEG